MPLLRGRGEGQGLRTTTRDKSRRTMSRDETRTQRCATHPDAKHGFLRGGDDELEPVQKQVRDVDREPDHMLRDTAVYRKHPGERGSSATAFYTHMAGTTGELPKGYIAIPKKAIAGIVMHLGRRWACFFFLV